MLQIDALVGMSPNLLAAMSLLGHRDELYHIGSDHHALRIRVNGLTEVLDQPKPERLNGLNVLGALPPRHAVAAKIVAVPSFGDVQHAGMHAAELMRYFCGCYCVRVEDLGPQQELADVIIAEDPYLRSFALTMGLAKPDAPMLERVRTVDDVAGKHVVGAIHWSWASQARVLTNLPLSLPDLLNSPDLPGQALEACKDFISKYVQDSLFSCRVYDVDPDELR